MENLIAANLYSQLGDEDHDIFPFKCIIDHKDDGSTLKKETFFAALRGKHNKCKPTKCVWKVLVEWPVETKTWITFKDVNEASPIELADY